MSKKRVPVMAARTNTAPETLPAAGQAEVGGAYEQSPQEEVGEGAVPSYVRGLPDQRRDRGLAWTRMW